jgi:hypothetical protein
MSTLRICPKSNMQCRGRKGTRYHCLAAHAHKCTPGAEHHGCWFYISQAFCVPVCAPTVISKKK